MTKRRTLLKWVEAGTVLAASQPLLLRAQAAPLDVIVIGAGFAGLHAARLLEEFGLKVRVLEASKRIGDRLFKLFAISPKGNAGQHASNVGR